MSRDHSQNHYGPNASFDGYDSDLASAGILIESLRQQLSAAIAACKLKHSALETLWIGTNREEWDGVAIKSFEDAVAIQPDDSALKDWIGEPVAYADPLDIAKDGNWDTFIVKHASECNDTLRFKAPLYSPKGLK